MLTYEEVTRLAQEKINKYMTDTSNPQQSKDWAFGIYLFWHTIAWKLSQSEPEQFKKDKENFEKLLNI